jgi:uncharacterized protein (TIGR03663 family)
VTASDAADNQNPTQDVTGPLPAGYEQQPSALDRRIDFGKLGWYGVWAAIALAVASLLRFAQLDAYVLSQREGGWAYDAWSLYTGKPLPAGQSLPEVSPLFLLLQTAMYFLFGVTDAIARSGAAIAGIGIVALIFALRPVLSRASVIGMAILAAVAPTLVFASRTVDPAILIGFFSLLAVVSILRAGASFESRAAWWAAIFGGSLAAMIASGPEGISAIIAIAVALAVASVADSRRDDDGHQGPVSAGLAAIMSSSRGLAGAVAAFVIVSLLAFSRLLSEASALDGFLITFRDWGRMMATQTSTTPTQFFFYATLLYELAAVVFASVALTSSDNSHEDEHSHRDLKPTLFVTWFVVALVLQSLASGRQADQTVLVTLPLVLLGGIGLGRIITRIRWRTLANTRDGLVLAAMFGLFFGIVGVITLIARTNDGTSTNSSSPWLGVLFIFLIVVIPFAYLVARESTRAHYSRYAGWCALLALTVLLGVYTVRTTTQLAWVRADTGVEMIAQRVPTHAVRSFVDQTLRLSRDLSVTEVSNVDNTGSFGLNIAIDPAVNAPFMWYFRDFPNVIVTTPAGWGDADMVIAPTKEGMEDSGYIVQSRSWLNRVPPEFESLSLGSVFSTVFSPSEWYDGFRFIFFRELEVEPVPEQISVGYTFRLSNQMNPSAGPFDLQTGQTLGPGTSLGQVNSPTGIALSNDGQTIYVVDSANQRIQRFGRDGAFLGAWSAEDDQRMGLGWFDPASQGASDIIVGPDDLIYVADTWNHRIMVLDADGNLVRELGRSGEITDTGNSTDPSVSPGLFYGPRSLAIADGELYVTDTGNERVQVFASDGTFLRAFGGTGSEPGQLLEPVGIAIGPDGNVYVADTGNARISVFTKQGEPVAQIPMPNWDGQIGQQSFLRFDASGILYITTPTTGSIQAWNGTEFVPVQGEGEGGPITAPVGMAIDQDGTMIVTETSTSRIVQFPIVLPEGFAASPGGATPGASPAAASPVVSEATPEPDGEASPPAVG